MLPFLRWQWLWRSRRRLLAVGLAAVAAGGLLLSWAVLMVRPWLNRHSYVVGGFGVFLIGWGGYLLLNVLLAPAGVFGDHDHDDSRDWRRRAWRRKRPAPPDDRPIPLAGTEEREAVTPVECPVCLARVPASAAECPKCHERFRTN